jgi:tripartite-type tricarboxylate transporter receptor subunit TctC
MPKQVSDMTQARSWLVRVYAIASLATALSAPPLPAAADSIADAFRGKTIKLLLPTAPGGGRALYALPFAEAYGRHLPGNPTVVPVFMPGAGGSTAVNNAYNVAAHDGLTIVSPLKSVVTSQAVGDPSVKYDVAKMNWLGRITDATQIFFVSSKVAARTLDDFRRQQVIVGAVGRASVTYQNAAFVNNVLGTKFKIVTGYQSAGTMNMSVASGETQGAFTTWNDLHSYHADWLRDGKVRVVLQIALAKHPELKDVPLLSDYAANDADRALCEFMSSSSDLGEAYAAPPGVPEPVVAALRKAFDETMQDPDYVRKLRAAKIQFNPMNGMELTKEVLKTIGAPKSLVARYKAAITAE